MTNTIKYRKAQILTEDKKHFINGVVAVKSDKVLRLTGEATPYQPKGGKLALESIINECKEGIHYEWVDLAPFLHKAP